MKYQIIFMFLIFIAFPAVYAQETYNPGNDSTEVTSAAKDSSSSSTEKPEKIKIIRRNYKYKRQVGVAVGMMLFIGIVMTSVQNWNPE